MTKEYFKVFLFSFLQIFLFSILGYAQLNSNEKHTQVSMRLIGHEILLNSGDSSSHVLPIKKEADQYKIQFDSEFSFNPEELVATIDSVVKTTGIANRYFVEVEKCETGEIIYSYEIGDATKSDVIPCATRTPEKACYNILFTIVDASSTALANGPPAGKHNSFFLMIALLVIAALMLIGYFRYSRKRKNKPITDPVNPNMLMIGEYQFDKINSELLIQDQRVPLSAKESDLLLLLYSSANTTVERDVILKNIWGDEGDYIGRTLDVFISKLRKKLEVDSSLKIVNNRGVGYKLLINVQR